MYFSTSFQRQLYSSANQLTTITLAITSNTYLCYLAMCMYVHTLYISETDEKTTYCCAKINTTYLCRYHIRTCIALLLFYKMSVDQIKINFITRESIFPLFCLQALVPLALMPLFCSPITAISKIAILVRFYWMLKINRAWGFQ